MDTLLGQGKELVRFHLSGNQWLDSYQIFMDTSFGQGKELIRFLVTLTKFSRSQTNWNCQFLSNFLVMWYHVNQLLDSYQICMHTSLWQGKELVRFWWPWPNFQVSVATIGLILTKYAWIHHWDRLKNWISFGDLYQIFKITVALKLHILSSFLVCLLSCELVAGFLPNLHGYIIGTGKRTD